MKLKHIIAIATLAAAPLAHANDIAYLANRGGGHIVLTSLPCHMPGTAGWRSYTYIAQGNRIEACYTFTATTVTMTFFNPYDLRSYPINSFTPTPPVTPAKPANTY